MEVGTTTTSPGEAEIIAPLVVGDGLVDAGCAVPAVVFVVGVRKAPRSRTTKMPRPARVVTAIETIRPAVAEMRGSRRPCPLGATEERYAPEEKSGSLLVGRFGTAELRFPVVAGR